MKKITMAMFVGLVALTCGAWTCDGPESQPEPTDAGSECYPTPGGGQKCAPAELQADGPEAAAAPPECCGVWPRCQACATTL